MGALPNPPYCLSLIHISTLKAATLEQGIVFEAQGASCNLNAATAEQVRDNLHSLLRIFLREGYEVSECRGICGANCGDCRDVYKRQSIYVARTPRFPSGSSRSRVSTSSNIAPRMAYVSDRNRSILSGCARPSERRNFRISSIPSRQLPTSIVRTGRASIYRISRSSIVSILRFKESGFPLG